MEGEGVAQVGSDITVRFGDSKFSVTHSTAFINTRVCYSNILITRSMT